MAEDWDLGETERQETERAFMVSRTEAGNSGGHGRSGDSGGPDGSGDSGGSGESGDSGGDDSRGHSGGADSRGRSGGSDSWGRSGELDGISRGKLLGQSGLWSGLCELLGQRNKFRSKRVSVSGFGDASCMCRHQRCIPHTGHHTGNSVSSWEGLVLANIWRMLNAKTILSDDREEVHGLSKLRDQCNQLCVCVCVSVCRQCIE